MKILLDANVPHVLRHVLPGHDVRTAAFEGWAALENGALIAAAEAAAFDVLITADQNLQYQQNLGHRSIALVVVTTNNVKRLVAQQAAIASAIEALAPGGFARVEIA